jgi:hypothetical protein
VSNSHLGHGVLEKGRAYNIEHEKAGGDWEESALIERGDTIRDRGHGVFADAPVHVATSVVAIDAARRT